MEEAAMPVERLGHDAAPADEVAAAVRIAHAAPRVDREAEVVLCRRMAPRVLRYGLRHLHDRHAAGDLMQQVIVRVIEQLRAGKVREPERIVSFIFGMCRMVVLEQLRGESRHASLLAQWGEVLSVADISVGHQLDHLRVADCMQHLPERERSVIVMSFYEERTAHDVAGMLGTTTGNVRVIRHRGLARLRDCVGVGRLR
jgi:RNA polymerase sigma-70 factor (ECF subfamily)